MESLSRIRKRAERARPIFDFLWDHWSAVEKWPPARAVYDKCSKELVVWSENTLNDAYLMECDPSHDPNYELRLFGVLSSSQGEKWLALLTKFWEFMQEAFKADSARTRNFASDEIGRYTGMDPAELKNLGRLLSFHPFEMMNLGYGSPLFVGWEAGIPKGFYDIGQPGDARERLETMLARRYQPRYPVGLEARQRALSRAASTRIDAWADLLAPAIIQPAPARRRAVPVSRKTRGSVSVFLSHSNKDEELASAMIELLMAAFGLTRDKICCTSVPGSKLRAGAVTDQELRDEIAGARAFIGLLTPASLRSQYVLAEVGARWQIGGLMTGLLAKGATASRLSGPVTAVNVLQAHIEEDLHQLIGDLRKALGKKPIPNAAIYLKELKKITQLSLAADPFVRYDGKRVKGRGVHKKDQYFVFQGRTHYVEFDAADVCEKAELPYESITQEEEDILVANLDDPLNAVQMRRILSILGK